MPQGKKKSQPESKPSIRVHCYHFPKKRHINMGTRIEQRPWTPTVRVGKIAAETTSPGPACVQLPNLIGAPSYTFGQKFRSKDDSIGPGPAQYNITGLGAKGKATPPAASLQSRHAEKLKFATPAPGEYNVDRASKMVAGKTPAYTFGHKPKPEPPSIVPGPNVYKIPTVLGVSKEGPIRSAPAYSMTGRIKSRLISAFVPPGPGAYDGDYTAMKRKPPQYTMSAKYKPVTDSLKPGPGAHCPEQYVASKSVSAPTFGILHTPYLGIRKACLMPASGCSFLIPKLNYCL